MFLISVANVVTFYVSTKVVVRVSTFALHCGKVMGTCSSISFVSCDGDNRSLHAGIGSMIP